MSVPSDSDLSEARGPDCEGSGAAADTCSQPNSAAISLDAEYIEVKPILKRKSLDENEIKTLPSILKKRDSLDLSSKHNVVKRHSLGSEADQRSPQLFVASSGVRDICSTPSSTKPSSQIHSILKHKSFDEKCVHYKEEHSLPKPILKKNLSIEDQIEKSLCLKNGTNGANSSTLSPSHSTKSILKSGSEDKVSANKIYGVKSILKNKNDRNDSKPVKSALKKSDQSFDKDSKVKSILKSESFGSSTERINSSDDSSSSSSEDLDLLSCGSSNGSTNNGNGQLGQSVNSESVNQEESGDKKVSQR